MECERIDPAEPIRQGDVFAAHPGTKNWDDPWNRFGVILSADCDIEQRKVDRGLVFAPIVTYPIFLGDIWLTDRAAKLIDAIRKRVMASLKDGITFDNILNWASAGPEALGSNISENRQVDGEDELSLTTLASCLPDLVALTREGRCTAEDIKGSLRSYDRCFRVVRPTEKTPPRKLIEGALRDLLTRVDTWLICDLEGYDADMKDSALDLGYVVVLRRFNVLPVNRLAVTKEERYTSADNYYRICRLGAKYRFDLLQRFSNMFMRVGLPNERPEQHIAAFEACAKLLSDWEAATTK